MRVSEAEADASASASDAGSTTTTFSTNPNSIFSSAATVRFGNVLSLEDFKGCPCPLDDIMEHEQQRDNRSTSPRSARADKTSRAASPMNHEDLDLGDFALMSFDAADPKTTTLGPADYAVDDESALVQAAVIASLAEPQPTAAGAPSSRPRPSTGAPSTTAPGGEAGPVAIAPPAGSQTSAEPVAVVTATTISARARGKQPATIAPHGRPPSTLAGILRLG